MQEVPAVAEWCFAPVRHAPFGLASQRSADTRHRGPSSGFACGDELRSLHEFVPQDVVHIRLDQNVGGRAPGLRGGNLNDREGPADHLDRVARFRLEKARLEVHGNHNVRAHFLNGWRGNGLRALVLGLCSQCRFEHGQLRD